MKCFILFLIFAHFHYKLHCSARKKITVRTSYGIIFNIIDECPVCARKIRYKTNEDITKKDDNSFFTCGHYMHHTCSTSIFKEDNQCPACDRGLRITRFKEFDDAKLLQGFEQLQRKLKYDKTSVSTKVLWCCSKKRE